MKLTNEHGAPPSIVEAIRNDPYTKDGADFSVTELIKPPQIRRLWNEHEDKVSVDVREEIWKLLGKGVHAVLEQQAGEVGIKEQRLHATYGDVSISGAIDLVDDGAVTDYKVTSTYAVMRGLKEDWERQLNLYAWLLRENGTTPTSLSIVAICRDWMRSRLPRHDYPKSPVVVMPVPMWSDNRQARYVEERVRVHTREGTIPCTPEERWARSAFSVIGGKGRPKSFDTMSEATAYLNEQTFGKTSSVAGALKIVENTDVKYIRCEDWCEVAEFCPQWRGGRCSDV